MIFFAVTLYYLPDLSGHCKGCKAATDTTEGSTCSPRPPPQIRMKRLVSGGHLLKSVARDGVPAPIVRDGVPQFLPSQRL